MTINFKTSIIVGSLLWACLGRAEETKCGDLDGVACGAGFFGYEMNEEIRGAPDGVDELWGTYYTNMRNPPKPFDRVRALYDVHGVCAVRGSFVVEGASESGVRQKEQVDILAKQLEPRYGKPDERYFNVPYNPNLAPSNDEGEIEEVRSFGGYSWQADGSPLSIDPHGTAGLAPSRYPDEVSVITLRAKDEVVELEYRFANIGDCVERNRPWARYDDDEGICSIWGLVARDFVAELEQQYLETLIYRWSGGDGDQNPYRDGRYYCRDHPDHVGGIRVYADESTVELQAVFDGADSCEQAAANRLVDYWVYSYLRGEEVCEAAFGHAWSGVGVCLMPVPVFLQARPEGDYVNEFDIGSPREGACIGDAETRRRRGQEEEEWRFVQRSGNPDAVRDFLERHPSGHFAGAARALLARLSVWPFTVVAEPEGAQVHLADGSTPYRAGMTLPGGEYRVEVSADGYETWTVTVRHGSPTKEHVALRKAGPRAGDWFRDCPECPQMVVVPAGSYRMGSPSHEHGRDENEGPLHDVTISAPFAIGRHEVTVAEFGRFVDGTGYAAGNSCTVYEDGKSWGDRADRSWRNPGFGQSGRFPVVCVNWKDAQAYVAWLSRETGEEYRLPSESEWEYAARAGTSTSRYWGEGESGQCRHANGADESMKERYSDRAGWTVASCRDGYVHTAPVGSFAANNWGLRDVLGNAREWTEDCWNHGYAELPSDGSAWEYEDCAMRVQRGGSWSSTSSALRAAFRIRRTIRPGSSNREADVGFRVARTLAP